jgi:uracil-DNA glycosylase
MARPTNFDRAAALEAEIAACRVCRDTPRGRPLPHEPRPVARLSAQAPILIVGQAPGRRVHESGLPFDDASGDRLRDWLGMDRQTFYNRAKVAFLPMGFCFPGNDAKGGDLPPRPECRTLWHERAMAAMPRVSLLVLLGAHAQGWHLHRLGLADRAGATLSETVGNWRAFAALREPEIFALPHPSWRNTGWLKRNPWFDAQVVPRLRAAVGRALKRPRP